MSGLKREVLHGKKLHPRAKDITGLRFGALTAIRFLGGDGQNSIWLVRCDCGVEKELPASEFRKGKTKSCGCQRGALLVQSRGSHGMSRHPAFAVWRSMLDRCRLPTHKAWKNYGGRGITTCRQWQESFAVFWADMGPTYQRGLSLERKDNSLGYTPENCVWADRFAQARNRRTNVRVDTPLGFLTLSEACEKSGLNMTTLCYRVANGWPKERLLDPPVRGSRKPTT